MTPAGRLGAVVAAALAFALPARAQDIRIDDATRFVMPQAVAGCAPPRISAGAGLVTAEIDCADARRVILTVVSGGGHLHSPADRLARAALAWRPGPAPAPLPQVLPTAAQPIAVLCITMPMPPAGVELTCVREEALTRIELVVEAPDAGAARALLAATLAGSRLLASR
jgi:hypothetical protein